MIAFNNYRNFKALLKKHETTLTETTIGILFVNFQQTSNDGIRALHSSLNEYNSKSGNDINFYVPGLSTDYSIPCFNNACYYRFKKKFEDVYKIQIDTSMPMLLLIEHGRDIVRPRHIAISILSEKRDFHQTDNLFRTIFSIAKRHASLEDFCMGLEAKHLLDNKSKIIEYATEQKWIKLIFNPLLGVFDYRIRE